MYLRCLVVRDLVCRWPAGWECWQVQCLGHCIVTTAAAVLVVLVRMAFWGYVRRVQQLSDAVMLARRSWRLWRN
jgi:hypothetical protein